jgi:hypothetical protein
MAPFYRFVSDPVSDPDSNPDRIQIRPKVSDPYRSGSGSGSATLFWRSGNQIYLLIMVNFLAPESRSGSRRTKLIRIHEDPDPQHWLPHLQQPIVYYRTGMYSGQCWVAKATKSYSLIFRNIFTKNWLSLMWVASFFPHLVVNEPTVTSKINTDYFICSYPKWLNCI